MKALSAKDRKREEDEETKRFLEEFKESLADVPDDIIAKMEETAEEKAGTYLKLKQEFLEEQTKLDADGLDDDLFADCDDDEDSII